MQSEGIGRWVLVGLGALLLCFILFRATEPPEQVQGPTQPTAEPVAAAPPTGPQPGPPPNTVSSDEAWQLLCAGGASGSLAVFDAGAGNISVVSERLGRGELTDVGLERGGYSVVPGQYELQIECRSPQPRSLRVRVLSGSARAPLTLAAVEQQSQDAWHKLTIPLIVSNAIDNLQIRVDLGTVAGPLELRDIRLVSRTASPAPSPAGPPPAGGGPNPPRAAGGAPTQQAGNSPAPRPGGAPSPSNTAHWGTEQHGECSVSLIGGDQPNSWRAEVAGDTHGDSWRAKVLLVPFAVEKGRKYELVLKTRSDRPRQVFFLVTKAHDPWSGLGLSTQAGITPTLETQRFSFIATESEPQARLHFDLGKDGAGVFEFSDVQLLDGSRDLAQGAARAPMPKANPARPAAQPGAPQPGPAAGSPGGNPPGNAPSSAPATPQRSGASPAGSAPSAPGTPSLGPAGAPNAPSPSP